MSKPKDIFTKQLRLVVTIGVGETKGKTKLTETQVSNAIITAGRVLFEAGFGGFTMVPVTGGWKAPDGRVVVEPGVSFIVLTESVNIGVFRRHVAATAVKLRDLFEQSCVVVEMQPCEVAFI